ncbi:DUF3536 domain-containing protein [Pontibacter sp. KCTC 32443]|uniref:DUF3536 domain-containing protein n=1 Tax=Pontibacter TaxID=323449 RepID=UPI00164E34C6|nr:MULTISPECIES: DUF3536 domain-containing protein [Pontibacter]MBC5772654.1 DUF3536 domain-containing protein [Pontibacter sp. KCTC 32443]
MERYICIHGHFYQPPRENPWLNEVEMQESASPYHDWNERITDECYARNSASRILDNEGAIVDILNNYAWMSFNFGPTLLEWMEKKAPETYQAILAADKESQQRFSGHGSALAQVYNHMIMPLANERDKHTQVLWGIYDFRKRFGRDPEGMWLGETAADTPTLEVLAAHGIKFTILSPYQAKSYRKIGETNWHDARNAHINPNRPYLCHLPSGKTIVLFYYNAPISQGVAFEGLLHNGEKFTRRLINELDFHSTEPQLLHIATDGETYGHHHRFGEMALSYTLHHLHKDPQAKLTIYAEYLEKHPPQYETQIIENSSWSCFHGVERWRSDCGCNTGGHPTWNQKWRTPLRASFDWLRDELEPLYVSQMLQLKADPWQSRNDYIQVIADRSEESIRQFILAHTQRQLSIDEQRTFLKLLEMQYHAMLMYTSCGWFFDEVTGIETMQDILYAARALQLAESISGKDYETTFLQHLKDAESNKKEYRNAAEAYQAIAKTTMLDLLRVGAHYAVSSLFSVHAKTQQLYSYTVTSEQHENQEAGRQKLAVGRARIRSNITLDETTITYGVLHIGDHQLLGGVREFRGDDVFHSLYKELSDAFNKGNVSEVIMLIDKHFESHSYSFWHLFRDDQNKIMSEVLGQTMHAIEGDFEQVYNNNFPLMLAMRTLNMKLPRPLQVIVEYMINKRLLEEIEADSPDLDEMYRLHAEAERLQLKLELEPITFAVSHRMEEFMKQLEEQPENLPLMEKLNKLLKVLQTTTLQPDYWHAQNIAFRMKQQLYARHATDHEWQNQFSALYDNLNMKA